jgi:cephalosporin hydroxylase
VFLRVALRKAMADRVILANECDTITAMNADSALRDLRRLIYLAVAKYCYTYNFTCFGRSYIQFPEDLMATLEILLSVQPTIVYRDGRRS